MGNDRVPKMIMERNAVDRRRKMDPREQLTGRVITSMTSGPHRRFNAQIF